MLPIQTTPERQGRIIPLRRTVESPDADAGLYLVRPDDEATTDERIGQQHADDRAHDTVLHYLALMLPAVPVVTFVMSFLYGYLLVGINSTAAPTADLALLGAVLMAATTGMLCLGIYLGVARRSPGR